MDIESSSHRILQSELQTQRRFPLLTPDPTPSNGCVLDAVHRTLSDYRSNPLVLTQPDDGFGKRFVSRPPSASLLTALLTSPKTSFSSPDLSATASDIFTDCDALSSGASSPLSHTPPRKCTFAAAPTEKKKVTTTATVQFGNAQQQERGMPSRAECKFGRLFSRQHSGNDQKRARAGDELAPLTKKQLKLDLPSVAQDPERRHEDEMQREHSVFDSANESDEPKLVNTWLPGEPKKLVDDCLEKDRQNAAAYGGDEEDEHIVDEEQDDEEEEEEEDDKEDDDDEDDDDDDEEEATPSSDRIRMRPAALNVPAANNFLGSEVNTPTCRPAPPSPSFVNDTTDFVPGTLDEDQGVETAYAHSLVVKQQPKRNITPQDIDPTYPDEEDDDDEEEENNADEPNNAEKELVAKPVVGRSPPPRCLTRTPPPPIRHGSLQPELSNWGGRRNCIRSYHQHYHNPNTTNTTDNNRPIIPKRAAIAIVRGLERKRHVRKMKREAQELRRNGQAAPQCSAAAAAAFRKGFGCEKMRAIGECQMRKQDAILVLSY